jgi:4,5-DOPA dioxygenase extradiol
MNTLERNRYTETWRAFGAAVERPRALLVISAHWYTNVTAVTAMALPRVIHDFFGFPDELFAFDYPAPGMPEVAEEVAEVAKPRWVGLDHDSWGLDHGTWSVLTHIFPEADVPVVQLSIDASKPLDYHFDLATRLAPLRERGVMILGSGNVVHNLGAMNLRHLDEGEDWARRFDNSARELMMVDPGEILELEGHSDFTLAAPTPDHFIPLLYLAGLSAVAGRTPDVLVDGYMAGSLSMISYVLDGPVPTVPAGEPGVSEADLPPAGVIPPEDTNL